MHAHSTSFPVLLSYRRAIDWRRKPINRSASGKNEFDTHKAHGKTLSYQKCVQKRCTRLKWELVIKEIQPLVCRKKLILICELGCVRGIMHFIIQSVVLDHSFPFLTLVCYIRLVYRTSNFQIIAIAPTSLVKDTFCLQLRQSNSKSCGQLVKKIKVLGIGNSFVVLILYSSK